MIVIGNLPPKGADLRAELAALQRKRVSQALSRTGGDADKASRLLRITRLDLMRLEASLAERDARRGKMPEPDAGALPRIADGVEFVSRAVIRRYTSEGKSIKWIAARLGTNPYLVERVVREHRRAEIIRLDAAKLSPKAIAVRLGAPLDEVRGVLAAASEGAR